MADLIENEKVNPKQNGLAEFLLILTTILWGTTFIITKTITEIIPPLFYIGIRFFIGFLVFIPFYKRFKLLIKDKTQIKISFVAGLYYFISIVTQTFGLRYTSASKGAFITAISVIMVPVFLFLFFKEKSSFVLWIGVIFALIGTGILSFENFQLFRADQLIGDFLIFICALSYAIYIIYIGRKVNQVDMISFTAFQLFLISVLSFVTSIITTEYIFIRESSSVIFTAENILILIYMGAVATSLPFLFQGYGQKKVSSTRAALIFALEPVFATFFAVILGGETLNPQTIIGSIFIFIGIIITIERKKISK